MTAETLNECASIRQTCLDEVAQLRADLTKELGRANEKIRALHTAAFQRQAAVQVELELLRRDVEWLEDANEKRTFGGIRADISARLDRMIGEVGYGLKA